jgi:thiamine biosynthesis protein ThiI
MDHVILLRYSEIGLKSRPVRRRFENILISNIRSGLEAEGIDFKIKRGYGRIFIETKQIRKTSEVLKRIFGLVSFSVCQTTDADMENMSELALRIAGKTVKEGQTFALKTRRIGNHIFTSKDVNEKVGETIVKKLKRKVNLTEPDKTIHIEIRDNTAYLYTETIPSVGGLPLGTQGKALSVIEDENGIVSSWLMMRRGCETILLFVNIGDEKVKQYIDVLKKWYIGKKLKYYCFSSFSRVDLKNIIKDDSVEGLVLSNNHVDLKQLTKMKKIAKIPVFTPLVGLSDREIQKIYKKILL